MIHREHAIGNCFSNRIRGKKMLQYHILGIMSVEAKERTVL